MNKMYMTELLFEKIVSGDTHVGENHGAMAAERIGNLPATSSPNYTSRQAGVPVTGFTATGGKKT